MHVELFLGSDAFRRGRALEQRRLEWADQINLLDQEVFDLSDSTQLAAAITAIRIGPLLSPARLVVWRNAEALLKVKLRLQGELEEALAGRADDLILLMECRTSPGKKGARPTVVSTCRQLQELLIFAMGEAVVLDAPAPWDEPGKVAMVREMASEIGLDLSADHAAAVVEMVGSDSARAATEVRKIQALAATGSSITTGTLRRAIDADHVDLAALHRAVLDGDGRRALRLADQVERTGMKAGQVVAQLQQLALQSTLISNTTGNENQTVAHWLRTSPGAIYFRRKEHPKGSQSKRRSRAALEASTTLAIAIGKGQPLRTPEVLRRYVAAAV